MPNLDGYYSGGEINTDVATVSCFTFPFHFRVGHPARARPVETRALTESCLCISVVLLKGTSAQVRTRTIDQCTFNDVAPFEVI